MAKIVTHHLNILEASTVTSDPAADSSYPVYRLYDRHIGRMYIAGSAATTTIHIDQGGSSEEVDKLIIPANHNLHGLLCTLSYSDNDSAWTVHKQWTQNGLGIIEESFTAVTHRYWRLVITSPSSAVQIPELFLTKVYTWERNPESLDRGVYPVFNVERREDAAGRPRFVEFGDSRRARVYDLYKVHDNDSTALLALNIAWAGKKPFYLKDHDEDLIFGELTDPLQFAVSGGYMDTPFNFLEVLA